MGYKHFNITERESILECLTKEYSITDIAKTLGRNKSSISRELKKAHINGKYSPNLANSMYKMRKKKCGRKEIFSENLELKVKTEKLLKEDLSPEQIEGRMKRKNEKTVCYKTIYRYIKSGILDVDPSKVLRRKGKSKTRGVQEKRGTIPGRVMIDCRPKEAEARSEIGHYESDTIVGAGKKGGVATFVDRNSRYLIVGKMENRTSGTMNKVMIRLFKDIPNNAVKTFTSDNGKEFAGFKEIEKILGVKSYFANPYRSWERGTNENTNGLLRQYFPKGTDFSKVTNEEIKAAVDKINNRPKKVLGFRTPNEVFWGELKIQT